MLRIGKHVLKSSFKVNFEAPHSASHLKAFHVSSLLPFLSELVCGLRFIIETIAFI